MTPREIIRYAKVMADLDVEREKRGIRLEYLNAALQRATKMPKLTDLLNEQKPPSLSEIMQRLNDATTFQQVDTVK